MRCSRTYLALWVAMLALVTSACSNPEVAKRRYLESGDKALAEHKVQNAIVQYRNAIRLDPRFGEARRSLAEAYVQAQNPQAAFREIIRAADLLPNDLSTQLRAGNFLLVAQRYDDAKARANAVLAKEPQNIEALIMKANATAGLKDVPSAINDLEEALSSQEPDARLYTSLGSMRLLQGNRAEAEAAYKRAIEVNPKSATALSALANFYLSDRRLGDAETILKQAIALEPSNRQANRLLALVYIVTRRAAEAEGPLKANAQSSDPDSRLALADYYVGMRKLDAAREILKDLMGGAAAPSATMRMATLEYGAGHQDAAVKMLDDLLAKNPQNAKALTLKARWQLVGQKYDDAVRTAQAATQADPGSAEGQYVLGTALYAKRNNAEAATALQEALRLNPQIIGAQVLLSRLQLAAGDIKTAAATAQRAKATAPTNPDAQLAVARSLLAQGNATGAEPDVRSVLARYPREAAAHSMNGFLLLAKKDAAGARAAFVHALELKPNFTDALEGLLALDAREKKLPDAVQRIEGRLASAPNDPTLLLVAARTYGAVGQMDKREKALQRAIEVDPDSMSAYLLLGQTYVAMKKLDQAVAQYDEVAKRHQNVGASTMAAILVQLQRRDEDARKRYEAIIGTRQRAPVASNNLAWMYAERGENLDVALQLAQDAKSQLPDTPQVSDTLGWVYYKKGLPQLAIAPLEESVKRDPKNPAYVSHLGLAYAQAGDNEKARGALQRALQISSEFEGVDVVRETLAKLK